MIHSSTQQPLAHRHSLLSVCLSTTIRMASVLLNKGTTNCQLSSATISFLYILLNPTLNVTQSFLFKTDSLWISTNSMFLQLYTYEVVLKGCWPWVKENAGRLVNFDPIKYVPLLDLHTYCSGPSVFLSPVKGWVSSLAFCDTLKAKNFPTAPCTRVQPIQLSEDL